MELKEQRFGVEIEFTGITRKMAAEVVGKVLGGRVSAPERNCYHTRKITDSQGRKWKVMRDSSVCVCVNVGNDNFDEYRCELVTPICTYEDIETIQEIVRALKKEGACVKGSSGIHIHVDGANHTVKSLLNVMSFIVARQDLVNDCLGNAARARWCRKTSPALLKAMKADKKMDMAKMESIWYSPANDNYFGGIDHHHYNETRYHGLNLHAFFTKGTVEFRLFNSTLHAGKIKAYIQFCLALSAWAINTQDKKTAFKSMEGYTAEKKVKIMKSVLVRRFGLAGDEYKTCRLHTLNLLKENAKRAEINVA